MKLKGKKIVVAGLAKSGAAIAGFLHKKGAEVTVTDMSKEESLGRNVEKMRQLGIKLELGYHGITTFTEADIVVLSPGVPHTIQPVQMAKKLGVKVFGEVELSSRFIDVPIIAVTGTNGKTTTTTLISEMLKKSGYSVFTGGNIGTPLIDYVENEIKADYVVAEISSFQLDTIKNFKPYISVLLNITKDHLDRYDSFEGYIRSKGRIFENQFKNDIAIINADDEFCMNHSAVIKNRVLSFSSEDPSATAFISTGKIDISLNGSETETIDIAKAKIFGKHNRENIAASALAVLECGGSIEAVNECVESFPGLPHRIEYTNIIKGVRFFNDSKATNPDAVIKAVDAFESPVVLILGGRNKGGNFRELSENVRKKIKAVIAIGEAKTEIKAEFSKFIKVFEIDDFEDAILKAFQISVPGDSILLSPACASFDMFGSYEERGNEFKSIVKKLKVKIDEKI